ncbi:MAG: beta-N-acetylhexosaminidase [Bdellovibrionales bacterium]|nr:beta-N-acetylhexosaminidase [Bdellovibrionales bacterium]
MRERIGQQLIIGLSGEELTKPEAEFIVENNIGGIILFDRNLKSVEQTHKLITDVQKLRYQTADKLPLFVSVDMEGGRVQRLKDPYTIWPPLAKLGVADSSSLCFQFTQAMGRELKAMGFNLDYAPCVDIFMNPENKVIGDRSLSSDPEQVAKLASALVRGYIKSEVLPCAKHFPGHGYTSVDSHFDLPKDERTLKDLEKDGDLEPFKRVIKARIDMIMTAHIFYPNIDPKWPVTLSPLFIQHFLRDALRFKGIIITDDLDMKALTKHHPVEGIPVQALKAGATMLLYCNEPDSPVKAVKSIARALADGEISDEIIHRNYEIIKQIKEKKLKQPIEPFSLDKVKQIIGCAEHKQLAQDIASGDVEKYLNKES